MLPWGEVKGHRHILGGLGSLRISSDHDFNLPLTFAFWTLSCNHTPAPANMSSMRNAVQRRNHKERAQPLERQKWGLLEKRKDYTLRAKDHNQKKRKLNALKAKAADRNEDEFYFGMMNSSSKNGVKVAKRGADNSGGGGKSLSMDVVHLMKTQDVAYLRTVLQSTRKEIERLEQEVVAADAGVNVNAVGGKKKLKFDDEGAEISVEDDSDGMEDFSDFGDLDGLDGLDDLDGMDADMSDAPEEKKEAKPLTKEEKAQRSAAKRKKHIMETRRNKLDGLQDRAEDLTTALRELEDQRVQMNGKAGGVNKNGTKFKVRQRVR